MKEEKPSGIVIDEREPVSKEAFEASKAKKYAEKIIPILDEFVGDSKSGYFLMIGEDSTKEGKGSVVIDVVDCKSHYFLKRVVERIILNFGIELVIDALVNYKHKTKG